MALQDAADRAIQQELGALGGSGGVIAVTPDGTMAWSFNTEGMYRARIGENAPLCIGLYRDDM
jgi:beta-aspartyl-peptidase (threonine type)